MIQRLYYIYITYFIIPFLPYLRRRSAITRRRILLLPSEQTPRIPGPRRHRSSAIGLLLVLVHDAADDLALDALLDGAEVVVLHEEGEEDEGRAEDDGDGEQDVHGLLVAPVDGDAGGRARRVGGVVAGLGDVAEDGVGLGGGVGGQVLRQLIGHELGPDGAGDGGADGPADLDHHEEHGRRGGHLLVARRGLDAELRRHVQHAAADAHRDLRAHEGPHRRVLRAVPDHEPHAQEVDQRARRHEVLVVARVLDHERDDDRGHRRCEGEGLRDVARGRDRLALHDEEVRVEIGLDREVEDNCVVFG